MSDAMKAGSWTAFETQAADSSAYAPTNTTSIVDDPFYLEEQCRHMWCIARWAGV